MTKNMATIMKHPGTMMSPTMTFSLESDVMKSPTRKMAFDKLIKETPLDYKPRPIEHVLIGYGGTGNGHDEVTRDAEMAYQAALLLWTTKDKRYGDLVATILSAWCETNRFFEGDNAPLEAAWSVCSFNRAAELLKAWPGFKISPKYFLWLDSVILPALNAAHVWRWKPYNNWHYSILCARMQTAILRDNRDEFNKAIQKYKEILPSTICCFGTDWCITETKRDLTHAQFLLGGIIQIPEMAYHQGVTDLFDDRLVKVFECHAALMLREIPQGIDAKEIKAPYGYWQEPVWEIAYCHFAGRKKIPMPKTKAYLDKIRPEDVTFHWGGCTLTHASS
jgi:hypothetical protein